MTKIGDNAWRKREAARKRREGLLQLALLAVLGLVLACFAYNVASNLSARNIHSGFDFLFGRAGFEIGESLITYSSSESFLKAFTVGMLNTVRVSLAGIVSATILGIIVGLMRLSRHPLIRFLGAAHVEVYRNIPLIIQLLVVYMVITELLPMSMEAFSLGQWALLSKAGLQFSTPAHSNLALLLSALAAIVVGLVTRQYLLRVVTTLLANAYGLLLGLFFAGVVWLMVGAVSGWSHPVIEGFSIEGGASLSPEFLALWLGLTFFTSAAIAEIVRAGILAVPHGQWAASYALGMSTGQTVSYIIFPQALRLAIPPLASQFMNLTKNSSLAVIIGYPDVVSVGNSTININGQALEVIVIIMAVYLTLNLIIAILMDAINRRALRGVR